MRAEWEVIAGITLLAIAIVLVSAIAATALVLF
jgi:hypothetical protein